MKVKVVYMDELSANTYKAWIKNANNYIEEYRLDGKYVIGEADHCKDIIEEWKELMTVTRYWHLNSDGGTYSSNRPQKKKNVIAIKKVTITEGEFDE